VDKQQVLNIICMIPYSCLSYMARKSHTPNYIVCGMSGCTVFFPHNLIKGTTFGKNSCVFRFSLQFLSETFIILRTIQ